LPGPREPFVRVKGSAVVGQEGGFTKNPRSSPIFRDKIALGQCDEGGSASQKQFEFSLKGIIYYNMPSLKRAKSNFQIQTCQNQFPE